MPIYEFYCQDCNTIFNFFSSRINTEKRPDCPKCGKKNYSVRCPVLLSSARPRKRTRMTP
ncbi:MAG: FmdB family zinc ribbon protein [Candidatus Electrothrix aestuarii]|uniref:FmdB family zinc ribbon protein n=1 Tax=Candidatus Electrothrix aestuarii TaxID=3062594 RepID=A0AAU8LQX9_9BACT